MHLFPKHLPLSDYEKKISAHNGIVEEGVIDHIVSIVESKSTVNKYCVELGAGDGSNFSFINNLIINKNWSGLAIEASSKLGPELIKKYINNENVTALNTFITKENILDLLKKGNTPTDFGFLCIDLDGNDYYILEQILTQYQPQVICAEFNSSYGPTTDFKVDYDAKFVWTGDDYFGASYASMVKLCSNAGYTIVHCTNGGDNLFFVQNKFSQYFATYKNSPEEFYQLPQYGKYGRAINGKGHPASDRTTPLLKKGLYILRYFAMNPPRKIYKLIQNLK